MTHRRDVIWLDVADSADDVRRKIVDTGYSRFAISDGELDKLLGYVRTRANVDKLPRRARAATCSSPRRSVVVGRR